MKKKAYFIKSQQQSSQEQQRKNCDGIVQLKQICSLVNFLIISYAVIMKNITWISEENEAGLNVMEQCDLESNTGGGGRVPLFLLLFIASSRLWYNALCSASTCSIKVSASYVLN